MKEELASPASSRDSSSTIDLHQSHVVVWDVPPAIECGTQFRVKVGVKCTTACRVRGWRAEVRDHDGNTVANAAVGDAVSPGTTALYYVELELRAPDHEGLHAWEVRVPAVDADSARAAAHAASTARFNVRAVPRPECLLKVAAIDAKSQTPVVGAKVVVHPYRAFTDAIGVAELRVPRGPYRLFVSGRNYVPFRSDGEVNTDLSIRAELDAALGPSDAELWS
jgi:hypothetical protein